MRILLLCTDAYGGHGGIALFNREFASAITAMPECEELVVVPRIMPRHPGEIPEKVTFVTAAASGRFGYARAIASARMRKFDLVICGHVNLLPVACALSPDPLLVVHGIEAWKPFRSSFSRKLLHRCRGVISVSALTRDRLVGWSGFAGRSYVLPNAVHLSDYGVRPKRPDLIERYGLAEKRVLLTVGRLVAAERYKGFDEIIEILPRLASDVAYLIAGSGDDAPRLEAKAAALGVHDRVVFTGFFPDAEKPDLYSLADIYVMPSRGEGFGFVLLEAMASGIPTIASKLDGTSEASLQGELGTLVDPTNSAEIVAALELLLDLRERSVPARLEYFAFPRFVSRVGAIVSAAVTGTPLTIRTLPTAGPPVE